MFAWTTTSRLPVTGVQLLAFQRYWAVSRNRLRAPLLRSLVSHSRASNRSSATSSCVMNAFSSNACQGAGTLDDAITRSKNSPDVQTIVPELPEVPYMPVKKRTAHLNHKDLDTLVQPLLSCHWHISRVGDSVNALEVLSLNKLFSFKNFTSAVEFFDLLAGIQNEENHHARVTVDYAHVYISTHTHCAYQNAIDTGVEAKLIKTPGLTSRDVRFAVKIEKLHETFLRDGRAVTKVPVDPAGLQAWSMEQLRRRYPMNVS